MIRGNIKMVWVPNVGRNAYLLSIVDVHTRRILKDYFFFHYPESVVIGGDNGSQFIAKSVREFLGLIDVQQELTYVATPEEKPSYAAKHLI